MNHATMSPLRGAMQPAKPHMSLRAGPIVRRILAGVGWLSLVVAALFTSLLAGWLSLAIVVLRADLQWQQSAPVPLILAMLVAVTAGLAWLVARYVASWRAVGLTLALLVAGLTVVGGTWALSAPDEALFLARDMAWDGATVAQVPNFPARPIQNGPAAIHFPQNLTPQEFTTIEYRSNGQLKQSNFDEFLRSTQTTSFIVLKDGAIRYEGYASGYTRDSVVTSFSMAKSVTSALIGIAIHEGYIGSVDDPVVNYLPELRGRGLDGLTIRHLLTMSTGIRYVASQDVPGPLQLLPFSDNSWTTDYPNLRHLALSVRSDGGAPGAAFKYNNYLPMLLGLILERTTHRSVSQYLQDKLWIPLGMEYPASWSLDSTQSGFEKMEQGLNARAIDFAKFGQLYLDNGHWNGQQIVPQQWVIDSTTPDPNDHRPWRVQQTWQDANGYYKYLWWGLTRPDGSYVYMARGGMQHQWIYVSPQDRVVIVRFGLVEGGADWWPDVFESVAARLH